MTEGSLAVASRDVLAHHARSFRWGAWFLPAGTHDEAAITYAFCRLVDDVVDDVIVDDTVVDDTVVDDTVVDDTVVDDSTTSYYSDTECTDGQTLTQTSWGKQCQ